MIALIKLSTINNSNNKTGKNVFIVCNLFHQGEHLHQNWVFFCKYYCMPIESGPHEPVPCMIAREGSGWTLGNTTSLKGQALEWAAQRGGGVTDPGGVQGTFGRYIERHGLARSIGDGWMVGLGDPVGLFQPLWFYDSMILAIRLKNQTDPYWTNNLWIKLNFDDMTEKGVGSKYHQTVSRHLSFFYSLSWSS